MAKRIIAYILAFLFLASAVLASVIMGYHVQAKALHAADLEVTSARAMCTMEASTGRVLYEKDADVQMPMASLTKIVTAITVLDNCGDLDTPFVVDPKAVGIEGTSIYIQKGERLSVRELLYGLMLRSGNDCAMALAYHVCPSKTKEEGIACFAELMKQTAEKAGAFNSNFKNPHGLDAEGHYTTAKDLALITAYAMKNPTFAEIVATKQTKISGVEYPRVLHNKNRLLFGMPECVGVKTGFTKDAGRCYVGAVHENAMTVICVVLNCGPMFEEAAELMEKAEEQFTLTRIIENNQLIDCDNCGDDDACRCIAIEDFFYPLCSEDDVEIICDGDEVFVKINGETVYTCACVSIDS